MMNDKRKCLRCGQTTDCGRMDCALDEMPMEEFVRLPSEIPGIDLSGIKREGGRIVEATWPGPVEAGKLEEAIERLTKEVHELREAMDTVHTQAMMALTSEILELRRAQAKERFESACDCDAHELEEHKPTCAKIQ